MSGTALRDSIYLGLLVERAEWRAVLCIELSLLQNNKPTLGEMGGEGVPAISVCSKTGYKVELALANNKNNGQDWP